MKSLRKILVGLAFLGLAVVGRAAPVVVSSAFSIVTGPLNVTCSTSTWTALTTSSNGTYGTFIKNLDANTTNVEIIATASSAAPSQSTSTFQQWHAAPSENALFLGSQGKAVYLWCVGVTSANVVTVTEVKPVAATYP